VSLVDIANAAGYNVPDKLLEPLALAALDPSRYDNERVTALESIAMRYAAICKLVLPLKAKERRVRRLLGVTLRASSDEVKKSYHRLRRESHPDTSKDPGTADRFDKIMQAWSEFEQLPGDYTRLIAALMRMVK
jgi:DnaJ-domain-containing protein 1